MEEAVRKGNLKRVEELIKGGADVNDCCKGTPLLSRAIKVGQKRIALALINHGANVHAKDARRDRTPLHWACEDRGQEEVVQRLIDRGSSVNEKDAQGRTPMQLAARWGGNNGLANCLVGAGASFQGLSRKQKNLLVRYASREGYILVVNALILNGCDLNTTNNTGNTPLMRAVEEDKEDVVKSLILKGAQLDLRDPDGYTALHHAAFNDHIQCGVLLTEGGANVGIKDKHCQTALNVAQSQEFEAAIKQAQSFVISKIVCIIGDTGVGKSTLVAALQAERNSFLGKVFSRFKKVADHRKRTAGIETIPHSSQRYGETLFYDYAGQHEYYGPHVTFLESIVCKLGVSMTLLLVVRATDDKETILDQLYYWLFPIAQMATSAASSPQIVIIGSFLDQVESKDEAAAKLLSCIEETSQSLVSIFPLKFMGTCLLDCRQPQSEGIDQLCNFLQEVPTPKLQAVHTQYSLAWVLSQIKLTFKDEPAVQLHTLAKWMQENKENLPLTIPSPEEVSTDLSAAGHALYLPNKEHFDEGWLVMDLDGILRDCYGALFSRHKESINKFGLLHCTELDQLFPDMCVEMVQQLLITLEFCTPVDLTVLSEDVTKLTASNEDSGWLLFPAFVSAESPKLTREGHAQQKICSLWWQLKTVGKHFFTARVLQTILLHLAAHFVVRHDRADGARQHCCSFWRNGISWQSKKGIDVTVHITNRVISVVGVREETADNLRQYLTAVIADVISTVCQVSPNLKADTYIVHRPMRMAVSGEELVAPSCKECFLVADIEASIRDREEYSLSLSDNRDTSSSRVAVIALFNGEIPTLEDIRSICWTQDPIQPLTEVNDPQTSVPTHHTSTACSSADLTLTTTVANNLPLSTAEAHQSQSLPSLLDVSSKPKPIDVDKLVVTAVAAKWDKVALLLEVDRCVIDIVSKNHPYDCEGACSDMLNRWLQGDRCTGEKKRTWSTLLTALGEAGYLKVEQELRTKYFKQDCVVMYEPQYTHGNQREGDINIPAYLTATCPLSIICGLVVLLVVLFVFVIILYLYPVHYFLCTNY